MTVHRRRFPFIVRSISFIMVLVAGANSYSQPPKEGNEPSNPVRIESKQNMGRGLTKAQLTNGLTVLVRENHAAPVATVRCFLKNTGSAYEGRFLGTGISHMLEHLVAGGTTTNRSEEEIQALFDKMGGQTNAFTSTDVTAFYIDCPAAHALTAIELIADNMQNSTIPENEYQREMGVVQRELEMGEADRDRVLHQAMKSLLYTEHPIRHPTIGYLAVVQQVTRQEVITFYKSRYVPQNMIFTIVGDVGTDAVLAKVLDQFKSVPRTTERGAVITEEPLQASPRSKRLEMEGETTHLSVGWPTVALQHPDMYALDVASYVLAHGDSSRISLRMRIDKPLAISVDSNSYTPGFVRGWFDVTAQCPPDNLEECADIIDEEVERLKSTPIPPQELQKVKRQKAAEHVFQQQTVQEQSNAMAMSFLSTGDPLFDEQYVTGIQSVTAAEVQAVAKRYPRAERTNMVIIDPIGRQRKSIDAETTPVEAPVVKQQLPNGLTILLKRHAVTPTVSIQAFVNAGVLSDSDELSGRSALTAELMTRGTDKFTGREIAEYFDSIGGSLSVSSQRNTSILQGSVLKDDWIKAMEYVEQVLFHPTFDEKEFNIVRDQQINRIAARRADPQTEIMDFWTQQLSKASPYSRPILGTEQSVAKLTAKDCHEFHEKYFVPSNMVFAIYGDIDPDDAFVHVEKLFGKLPQAAAPTIDVPTEHKDVAARNVHLPIKKENTAMVVISYPTVNVKEETTRAALDILNVILTGGGGAGGRLFQELRGERLVYYVFGMEITGPAAGYFVFMAQTRPDAMKNVANRIHASVRKIAKEGVSEEEFNLAKEKLLAAEAMRNTTPASQAFQAAIDELYGFGYDHRKTYNDRVQAVTLEEMKNVANHYFQFPLVATSSPDEAVK